MTDGASGGFPRVALAQVSLTVNPTQTLTILTTSLPAAAVEIPYTATLTATGGTGNYTNWTVTVGALPAGLSLTGGAISGKPTAAGTSTFTVQVTDSNSNVGSVSLSITVSWPAPPPPGTTTITSYNNSTGATVVGLTITVDGNSCQTPCYLTDGLSHSVSMPSPEVGPLGNGSQAIFTAWSDAGANPHTIQAGATVAVDFTTYYQFTGSAVLNGNSSGGGSVVAASLNSQGVAVPSSSPPTGCTANSRGWLCPAGTSFWVTGQPNSGFAFIALDSLLKQQDIVMNSAVTVVAYFTNNIFTVTTSPMPRMVRGGGVKALYSGSSTSSSGTNWTGNGFTLGSFDCYSITNQILAAIGNISASAGDISFDAGFLSGGSAAPGEWDMSCSCNYFECIIDMGPVGVEAPSPTGPVVTSVSPDPLLGAWQAGATFSFSVYGYGFGSSPTLTIEWLDGSSYTTTCSGLNCDTEIDGVVTVPAGAAPQATATVSTSSGGQGFAGSGGGSGTQSGPYTIRITPTPVTLNVTWNGSPVSQGSTVWITPDPALSLVASLAPTAGGSLPSGLNVTWSFQSTYNGPDGAPYSSSDQASQPANTSWNVTQALPKGSAPGGSALLSASYQGNTHTITFNILGQNPDPSAVQSALGTSPWFIQQMAQQESPGYQQFTSSGYPYFGAPHGYGIMQLDPPRSVSDMWVWTTNVADGVSNNNTNQNAATTRWNQQVTNWNNYNAENPSNPVAMQPNITTGNCTFSYTPSGGQHPFSDGIWIKFYNTGSGPTANPYLVFHVVNGQWKWDVQDGQGYVQGVCGKTA